MEKDKSFHVLETEEEFDRLVAVTFSCLGTSMLQSGMDRKEIDELTDLTAQNFMLLCAEYRGLVNEGKMKGVYPPEKKTREEVRKEVLEKMETIEKHLGLNKKEDE